MTCEIKNRNEKRNKPNLIHISNKYPPTKILECLLMLYGFFCLARIQKENARERAEKDGLPSWPHVLHGLPSWPAKSHNLHSGTEGGKDSRKGQQKKKNATEASNGTSWLEPRPPAVRPTRPLPSRLARREKSKRAPSSPRPHPTTPPDQQRSSLCTTPVPSSSTAPAPLLNVERKPVRPAP